MSIFDEPVYEPEPCPNCQKSKMVKFDGCCTLMRDEGLPHFMCESCGALVSTKGGPRPPARVS